MPIVSASMSFSTGKMTLPSAGRPSEFTPEKGDAICERLVEGESLRSICLSDDMPAASTVCRWLANNEAFRKQYACAREAQADTLADESLDIADDGTNDWMERKNDVGEVVKVEYQGDHVQRSRLRIDTRKWLAGKLAPKKYGDKVALVGGDPETDQPIQYSDRERAKAMAALISKSRDNG